MEQHTYSFPKVTPADARELREGLRARRRADEADRRAASSDEAGDDTRPDGTRHQD